MKTPGITVRPIQTIDGSHEVNEVFFDDVKVPVENRIYEENKGWDCAKFLLGNERSGIARVGASKAQVRRLREIASMERVGDKPLIEDERFAMKIAAIEVELKALEMTQLRVVAAERTRKGNKPDPASSILKIKGSEIQQSITRAPDGGDRPLRAARPDAARRRRPLERAADRPGLRRAARAAILQLAQDLDLRRLERDPEEHHREGDTGTCRCFPPRERRPLSSPAKAGDPVITRRPVITGCPACAGHDDSMLMYGVPWTSSFREEQRLLKDSVERLTAQRYDFEARKKYMAEPDGWSRALWKQYVELGLTALPFAEEHGGIGGGPVETMIVMEAFGRALALEPYFATVVLGGGFLRRGASEAAKSDAAAEDRGRRGAAGVRPCRAAGALRPRRRRDDGAGRTAPATCSTARRASRVHGDCADQLIVSARVSGDQRSKNGIGLFLVDAKAPGVSRRGYPTVDGLRAAEVTLSSVKVGADAVIGEPGNALSADRAGGRRRRSRRLPPKRSAR